MMDYEGGDLVLAGWRCLCRLLGHCPGCVCRLGGDQGHREFPFGNSREFPGISLVKNSRREFPGITEFSARIYGIS